MLPREPLTSREIDILPLVIGGLQRGEIAKTLGIAEETVKIHLRNLFSKFGGKSLRDTMLRLKKFNDIFIVANNKVFYQRMELIFELGADGCTATLTRNAEMEVVREEVTEERFMAYNLSGGVKDVSYNGLPMTLESQKNAKRTYVYKFEKPLVAGDKASQSVQAIASHSTRKDIQSWKAEISYPCRDYFYSVKFDHSLEPRNLRPSLLLGGQQILNFPETVKVEEKQNEIRIAAKNPPLGYVFCVDWDW